MNKEFNLSLSIEDFKRDYNIYLEEQVLYLKSLRSNQYRRDNIYKFEELIKGDSHKIDYKKLYSHYVEMFKEYGIKSYSVTMILNFSGEFIQNE